jgi:SAM-dependent methyltransferase
VSLLELGSAFFQQNRNVYGLAPVFVHGSMTSGLPHLVTASSDIVFINSALQYLGDTRDLPILVNTLFRITRPGGYIIIADVQDAALQKQAMADRVKNYVEHQNKTVATKTGATVDTRTFFYQQDFIKLGRSAGVTTRIIDTTKDLKIPQALYFNAPYSYTIVYQKKV